MHWKYKTERSTCDRKHSPLTWDLAIWGAVLGKDLIWVRFVCYRGGEGVSLPGTPRICGELQIQVKHHPPGHQLWDRHSFPQENCPELWIAPWRRAQGREGLGWPQPLSFFHVFCLLALKQESKGCGAGQAQGKEAKSWCVHLHSGHQQWNKCCLHLHLHLHLQTSSLKCTFEKQNGVKADTS